MEEVLELNYKKVSQCRNKIKQALIIQFLKLSKWISTKSRHHRKSVEADQESCSQIKSRQKKT